MLIFKKDEYYSLKLEYYQLYFGIKFASIWNYFINLFSSNKDKYKAFEIENQDNQI